MGGSSRLYVAHVQQLERLAAAGLDPSAVAHDVRNGADLVARVRHHRGGVRPAASVEPQADAGEAR